MKRLWLLAALVGLLVGCNSAKAPVSNAVQLPAAALGDDVDVFLRINLANAHLANLRAAAQTAMPNDLLVVAAAADFDTKRSKLANHSANDMLITRSFLPGLNIQYPKFLFDVGSNKHAPELEPLITKFFGGQLQNEPRFRQDNQWLVVGGYDETGASSEDSPHRARLNAAAKYIGTQHGIAISPSDNGRKRLGVLSQHLGKGLPAGLAHMIELVLKANWTAARFKLDADPSGRMVMMMPDEATASEFIKAWPAFVIDAHKIIKSEAGHGPSMGTRLLEWIVELKPVRQNSQIDCPLDGPAIAQLYDLWFLQGAREMLAANDDDHPWMEMAILNQWVQIYRDRNNAWPNTLDDLRPLLGESSADQAAAFKKLLTNSKTGQHPAFRYTKPKSAPDGGERELMLVELKGGQPAPKGIKGYSNSDMGN